MLSGNFWSMGGYARFVWPCIGFVCAVLAWNVWAARRLLRVSLRRAQRSLVMAASDGA
jgi:heme exporter protein CcmD